MRKRNSTNSALLHLHIKTSLVCFLLQPCKNRKVFMSLGCNLPEVGQERAPALGGQGLLLRGCTGLVCCWQGVVPSTVGVSDLSLLECRGYKREGKFQWSAGACTIPVCVLPCNYWGNREGRRRRGLCWSCFGDGERSRLVKAFPETSCILLMSQTHTQEEAHSMPAPALSAGELLPGSAKGEGTPWAGGCFGSMWLKGYKGQGEVGIRNQ